MKIVVFAPHPDDEIFGCGGSILKWLEKGHDVHLIYVTDNRALIEWGIRENQLLEECAREYMNLSKDEIAEIALKEAEHVSDAFGFEKNNVYYFKIHDQDAENNIELGVELASEINSDAERIVMPSDHNNHNDHQATHTMAKETAKRLSLKNAEYYVYALYNVLKAPKEKQIKIKVAEYQERIYDLMKGYKTQLCLKDTRMGWKTFKRRRSERFGVFNFGDMDKYENF
jgi:LmbE family N-acetylglucosaminyl deacetylase